MNQSNKNMRKLWQTLSLLLIAVILVIVVDSLSFGKNQDPVIKDSSDTDTTVESESDILADDSSSQDITTDVDRQIHVTTLTFLGECAPGSPLGTNAYGSFNALAAEKGTQYFFEKLSSVLRGDDLTIVANSCLFSTPPDETESTLCAAPHSNAEIYKVGSVELAANLSPHFGDLLADTQSVLSALDIVTAEHGTTRYFENNGIKIAVFFTRIEKGADLSAQIDAVSAMLGNADYRIVYFYGGEQASHTQEDYITEAAHAFADAGASLIVGTGNGVLRPMEVYNGTTIVYSLGVLIDGAQLVPENAAAILQLQLTMDSDGILIDTINTIPCYVYSEKWQPTLMYNEADMDTVIRFLAGKTPLPVLTTTDE